MVQRFAQRSSAQRSLAQRGPWLQAIGLALLALVTATQSGCLGIMANLIHAVGADKVPAEFDELEDCHIAVVTLTDNSQYSDDVVARTLSRRVGEILLAEVKDLTLVREDQIEQWRDTHGWDSTDYVSIGRGVEADKIVGIELTNLRLRDGATLYRGRADVLITVIETKTGAVVFKKELDDFTYPVAAGQYTTETTETKFQRLYLNMLAKQISRTFHPYDFAETVALDAAIASQ